MLVYLVVPLYLSVRRDSGLEKKISVRNSNNRIVYNPLLEVYYSLLITYIVIYKLHITSDIINIYIHITNTFHLYNINVICNL